MPENAVKEIALRFTFVPVQEVTKGVVELSIPAITFTDFPSFLNKRPPLSPPPEQGDAR